MNAKVKILDKTGNEMAYRIIEWEDNDAGWNSTDGLIRAAVEEMAGDVYLPPLDDVLDDEWVDLEDGRFVAFHLMP